MESQLTRRTFLKIGLSGAAVLLMPIGCGDGLSPDSAAQLDSARGEGAGRFFDEHQYETIRALTELLIPADQDPGAAAARVADYIDYLLGAFTVDPPRIYAAGPYSGRHGGENGFAEYLPLSRVKEIAWRNYLEGSQGLPEREFNGPVIGMQTIYVQSIAQLDAIAQSRYGMNFRNLPPDRQQEVYAETDARFREAVVEHAVEGMYAAPEYGGNRNLVGWKYINYEGDRQPIGYTRQQMEEPDEGGRLSEKELAEAAQLLRQLYKQELS